MLTRLTITRFKRFERADIELGNPVVFVGPNDAGKTTALQALLLWQLGLSRYLEKRKPTAVPDTRPGIAINRKDLTGIPAATARLLWHNRHVRHNWRSENSRGTDNVRIDILVEGIDRSEEWKCGLEFDFANEESIYVRPLRVGTAEDETRMLIPERAAEVKIALLAPMSGLAANETLLPPGAIEVRIGEGRTAEVLRNLCFQVVERDREEGSTGFEQMVDRIDRLWHPPAHAARGRSARRARNVVQDPFASGARSGIRGTRASADAAPTRVHDPESGRGRVAR